MRATPLRLPLTSLPTARQVQSADFSRCRVCPSEHLLSGAARREQNEAYQHLSRESNSLNKSEAMIDQMMNQGAETLKEMGEQRSKLKGAQRKLLDVMNTLGLSTSLMRVIERRQKMDQWLVYFGMLLTLALIYLLYSWKYSTAAGGAGGVPDPLQAAAEEAAAAAGGTGGRVGMDSRH